jgi:hypothetical protein
LDTIDVGEKINVDQSVVKINKNLPKNEQISATGLRNRLKDTKLNTRAIGSQTLGQYHGELSDAMKSHIEEAFHDQGIDFKKGKYGIKSGGRGESKALYESIRRFVEGGKWNAAYNVGAADGWLLESFSRANYKPIREVIKGHEKIIGYEAPDGTKWFAAKKYATKYNGKQVKEFHPSYKRVKKLVNIVGETRVAPSQAIADLLAKRGVKNIDGLTLERLANYLIDETDVKTTKSAFHKHHVKGVRLSPEKAIQLVTREANKIAEEAKKAIKLDPTSAATWDTKLKDMGIKIDIDGKSYGGPGFESKADIEKWATKKIGELDNKKLLKFFKDSGIPCIKGAGGTCTTPEDFRKGFNQIVKEAADGKGSAKAINKLGNFTKAMRGVGSVAKWTGYGLLAEAGFMVPFAIADYSTGESWKRILGNATDYGFGPIFGQSEQEEFEAALPENSLAVEGEKALELGDRYMNLQNQTIRPQGRIGMDQARREKSRENVLQGIKDELTLNLDPFLSDTPWVQGGTEDAVEQLLAGEVPDQWHAGLWTQAHQDAADARAQIVKEKQKRIDERTERGIIADRNWQSQIDPYYDYAEGGIASLMKKK